MKAAVSTSATLALLIGGSAATTVSTEGFPYKTHQKTATHAPSYGSHGYAYAQQPHARSASVGHRHGHQPYVRTATHPSKPIVDKHAVSKKSILAHGHQHHHPQRQRSSSPKQQHSRSASPQHLHLVNPHQQAHVAYHGAGAPVYHQPVVHQQPIVYQQPVVYPQQPVVYGYGQQPVVYQQHQPLVYGYQQPVAYHGVVHPQAPVAQLHGNPAVHVQGGPHVPQVPEAKLEKEEDGVPTWDGFRHLTPTDFQNEVISDSENVWIVAFIDPYCGGCQRLANEWPKLKAAESMKSRKVKFGYVDISVESQADIMRNYVGKNKVQLTPTVLVYGRDKANPKEYLGDYSLEDLDKHVCNYCDSNGYEKVELEKDLTSDLTSDLSEKVKLDVDVAVNVDDSGKITTEQSIEAGSVKIQGDADKMLDEDGNLKKPDMPIERSDKKDNQGTVDPEAPIGENTPDEMDIIKLLGDFAITGELESHGSYDGFEFMNHHQHTFEPTMTFEQIVAREQELKRQKELEEAWKREQQRLKELEERRKKELEERKKKEAEQKKLEQQRLEQQRLYARQYGPYGRPQHPHERYERPQPQPYGKVSRQPYGRPQQQPYGREGYDAPRPRGYDRPERPSRPRPEPYGRRPSPSPAARYQQRPPQADPYRKSGYGAQPRRGYKPEPAYW